MDTATPRQMPEEPRAIEDTGLTLAFIANLALKTMHTRGFLRGHEIAESLHMPFTGIVDKVLDYLRREHLTEVRGSSGFGESSYQYVISDEGRSRARELMDHNQYIGPAPVTLDVYTRMVKAQSLAGQAITINTLKRALAHLVIHPAIMNRLGPAVNSGKSIFLFGDAGNGKTSIAEAIGGLLPGVIRVPFAVCVDDHIVKVFDALHHRLVPEKTDDSPATPGIRPGDRYDRRWALIYRPLITAGGELAIGDLDLILDPVKKFYQAPYQMRANGGVFLVDDFGRQQVSPRDLLNRWIVPLEKRVDYFTLANGHKIDVPFDALIIFATNLNPKQLVDEAFLRRIRYKIHIPDPTWDEYREIFKRECAQRSIAYADDALRYLVTEQYLKVKRKPRAVHPRDILDELVEIARFHGAQPVLSKELLNLACQAYFLTE